MKWLYYDRRSGIGAEETLFPGVHWRDEKLIRLELGRANLQGVFAAAALPTRLPHDVARGRHVVLFYQVGPACRGEDHTNELAGKLAFYGEARARTPVLSNRPLLPANFPAWEADGVGAILRDSILKRMVEDL
jgi:hypothetical protein